MRIRKLKCSVLQLASFSRVAIFHFAQHPGITTDAIIPPSLRLLLENPAIIKTGRGITTDANKLRKYWSIHCTSLVDLAGAEGLQRLIKDPDNEPRNQSLLALAEHYLSKTLAYKDGSIHDTEDWSQPLTSKMKEYAFNDAFVGLQIYRVMNTLRLSLTPIPELPTFAVKANTIPPPDRYPKTMSPSQKSSARKNERISELSSLEARLYAALEARRNELAAERGLEARDFYKIADRKAVLKLSETRTRPKSVQELEAMSGMGKYAKKYAEEWMRVIKNELWEAGKWNWWNQNSEMSLEHVYFFIEKEGEKL